MSLIFKSWKKGKMRAWYRYRLLRIVFAFNLCSMSSRYSSTIEPNVMSQLWALVFKNSSSNAFASFCRAKPRFFFSFRWPCQSV